MAVSSFLAFCYLLKNLARFYLSLARAIPFRDHGESCTAEHQVVLSSCRRRQRRHQKRRKYVWRNNYVTPPSLLHFSYLFVLSIFLTANYYVILPIVLLQNSITWVKINFSCFRVITIHFSTNGSVSFVSSALSSSFFKREEKKEEKIFKKI